jgi:ferritin
MGYSKEYILETISPNKIIRYLKENGWHLIENKSESPNYLFAKIDNEFEQLTVPKKKGHSLSYQALITDIIYDISDNNKISRDEVINNIIDVDKTC